MSSPKVFESGVGGPIPLPHHAEDETQVESPSRKRSADVLESLTPRQKKARTEAMERERRRYEKLKADPLCHVSPTCGQSVQCDRCGSVIKLSLKNNFDGQHWFKHRKLCVRRRDDVAAAMRAESSLARRKTSCTPELTTDDASETTRSSVYVKSEPPDSRPASPSPVPPHEAPAPEKTPWLDHRRHHDAHPLTSASLCVDYMAYAHPDIPPARLDFASPDLDVLEEIRKWTPARIKPPVWFVPDSDSKEDEGKFSLKTPVVWSSSDEWDPLGDDEETDEDSAQADAMQSGP
ncbi:hypothetical protein OH77DRAFT_1579943 [Trametes cingulata]|nr:hypothetical protein OH77DRAFT_1579943 [Trametes cingulata]